MMMLISLGTPARVACAAGKRRVVRLDAVKVQGQMKKPQAFYVLQKSSIGFEALELKESFVGKIMTSINEKPF